MEEITQGAEQEVYSNQNIPRSRVYKDKTIVSEGYVAIKETQYFKRSFMGGGAELVRYDYAAKKWIILCFSS